MDWPLAEAKNRLSELFQKALDDGPQRIVRRGKDAVVVLPEAEYERLRRRKSGFIEHLLRMPKGDLDLVELIESEDRDADAAA